MLLARYIRLELLEGVAAFYAGDRAKAKAALDSARAKWQRLQVSDDRLAELLGMGFTSTEVTSCPAALPCPSAFEENFNPYGLVAASLSMACD